MKQFVANAFGVGSVKTVDSVLAAFRKTVDDLREVETAVRAEALRQEQIEMEAQLAKEAANTEAARAASAITRFEKLVGDI